MVINIFTVHIFFGEVAAFVLENFTIHRENLWKQADLDLFFKLICRIPINKNTFSGCMSMKVQKSKVLSFIVKVHNDFFDCIYRRMIFRRWINITSIEVDPVWIDSIVSSSYPIGVENREEIKHELVPQKSGLFSVFGKRGDDPCHDMRTGYFSRMNPCPYNNALLLGTKLSGLILIGEEMFVLKLLIFVGNIFFGGDG